MRTYAPFVAGIGQLRYRRFLFFNVSGAMLWVLLLTYLGYFFGNLPVVRDNLTLAIMIIIVLSILPGVFEYWRHRRIAAAQLVDRGSK